MSEDVHWGFGFGLATGLASGWGSAAGAGAAYAEEEIAMVPANNWNKNKQDVKMFYFRQIRTKDELFYRMI